MKERHHYPLDSRRKRIDLWVYNCGGQNASQDLNCALAETNTAIPFFPPCATDLVHPADSFVISKIKDDWTRRWDIKKLELIKSNECSYNVLVRRLRSCRNLDARQRRADLCSKSMICCGLSLDATGFWHVKQLTPELQAIIAKYENYFEGELGFPPGVAAASM
ncbi:unnamed protein product [Peronospora effusa]|uniref:DDE-1 domain-containing protein n=1 Tax=Peronospora effusa TaxID=542832 RepID=A0A3M6VF06_9STRA|nr:hypothetical protein DD238_005800 [Peronospora effusa]RQM16762.1 hypothetical protein DD237_000593 [Peronospora effusa]CAI5700662.1 unnamed protein product [Peronospora effusa]